MPSQIVLRRIFELTLACVIFTSPAFAKKSNDPRGSYIGPLVLMGYDKDLVLTPDSGEFFRVFRWREQTSPALDLASLKIPPYVDIPMSDWENGVRSAIQQYDRTPIKLLVGEYIDPDRHIRKPGNAYYDEPITLSSSVSFNPRFYFKDAFLTNYNFRTDADNDHFPLISYAEKMVAIGKVGPAWRLFKLTTRDELPVFSMIITMGGNEKIEWDKSIGIFKDHGFLSRNAKVDRIYSINNPRSVLFDETSTSQYGRIDYTDIRRKVEIAEANIDQVLARRIDRQVPARPNVLMLADDNIEIIKLYRAMAERKVRAVQDFDRDLNKGQAPLRIVIWNLAEPYLYAPIPNALRANPAALANHPLDVGQIMVFDSNFRYTPGKKAMEMYTSKTPDAKVLSLAVGISERRAEMLLEGELDCGEVLVNPEAEKKMGARP